MQKKIYGFQGTEIDLTDLSDLELHNNNEIPGPPPIEKFWINEGFNTRDLSFDHSEYHPNIEKFM